MSKPYGLIKPDKSKVIQRPSIFNSDSDSDNEPEKPTGISALKKKERMAQEKAIADDPTIYQYDELYDDMQSKRKESKLARKDLDKKPKYINKLLESAERRKRENERRIERQVQKEREEEGDMFKDKESFVTTAYRKKLEELKELEEKEKREDYLEAIGDVKKQSDLSGFYRHLYAQQVNSDDEKSDDSSKKAVKLEPNTSSTISTTEDKPVEVQHQRNINKKRKYRKRETSKSEQSSEDEKPKMEHLPSNIDADSDFSIDSDSDDSDKEPDSKKTKPEIDNSNLTNPDVTVDKTVEPTKSTEKKANGDEAEDSKEVKQETKEEVKPVVPKKPKIDIWKKRTVGAVFDEALRRFYERKSAKLQTVT